MTAEQFLRELGRSGPAAAYLFVGPEAYQRRRCRQALMEAALPEEERESGLTRHDLEETTLNAVLDDARSFSLFSSRRLLWVAGAEAALPRRLGGEDEPGTAALADYLKAPSPGVTVVFDTARYGMEGDDKAKLERVRKFYAAIPAVVEFAPLGPEEARALVRELARLRKLEIGTAELGLLVETLGGDAGRIAAEIEKLSLFAGPGGRVTREDIAALVPDARAATLFALVAALGRGDRERALTALDVLLREGEYMPLALAFLGTQFRLALAAQEAGLRSAQQIQAHFTKLGIRIWRDRAEQVAQTVNAFPRERLEGAIRLVFGADRALRDARPDDRVVLEQFVFRLTAAGSGT